ncbi:hypothetical protein YC2023_031507 [Brassica napus]
MRRTVLDDISLFIDGKRLGSTLMTISKGLSSGVITTFTPSENNPTVLLVTTVNTKRLAGNLALSSVASSRVFIDKVVQPTIDYFSWFSSNPGIATLVNAEEVTKAEPMTILQIFAYIQLESAELSKEALDPFADANAEDSGAGTKEYVHIRVQQRNGRKSLTTVQGLKKEYIYSNILRDLKKEFCCNGTLVQSHVHVYFTARYLRTSRKSFVATVHWLQTQ